MKRKKKRNNIRYPRVIILISLLLFCLMIARVTQLGLSKEIDGTNLKELAKQRTTATKIIEAKRGSIYTSSGDALALNVSSYKLIAYLDAKRTTNKKHPHHVVDKELTAEKLAPILGMEKEDVLKYLSKENIYQTEFGTKGKGLNELTKKKIEDLNLPGLDFIESYKRYYPKGDFASYTIGYAKADVDSDNTITGEMGIEKKYDKTLKGEDGYIKYQKDRKGYRIADTPVIEEEAVQGKDIYLTIDDNIQFFIEQALNNSDIGYDWDWFTITIADAKTGAILGTSSSPSFDPNKRDMTSYLDMMIASPYEPGSTMKTFTYMAALENGVYDGSETFRSGVYKTSDGTEIGDWNRNGWGTISFDKGYALSSNVGIINLIHRHMNANMLRSYFKKLGFGKKTGIELPGELPGYLGFKYETEIFNAGFGQGITTTPIQNIQALTPLTNDGVLLKPYIISKIEDPSNKEIELENKRDEQERVASSQTVAKILQLMDDCVNGQGNTGSGYRIDNGELIGKTGTSQIAREKGGGYLTGQSDIISSFAGIYPKSDPKIIIYASVKRPSGGSQKPISNAVKEIVNNMANFYTTTATEKNDNNTNKITTYKVPNFINKKLDTATTNLQSNGIHYVVIGNGSKVMKQTPSAKEIVTTTDTIYLITNDSKLTIPNVHGLSSKIAKNLLQQLNVKVNLDGVGYVTEQSIPEGTEITEGMEITLKLNPKFTE